MTAQEKQKSLIPVLRTLLILTVSAMAFGTEAMAQPGDTDNPGAGVAAILDEDTVPEEASLKTAEQEVRVGEAALAVSVGRQQNKNTGKTQEELELVMTNVSNTLNVRKEPDEEAEKIGYLYADCGGTILERKDGWTKLESGGLIGWAKDEYLLFDEEAVQEARQVGRTMATVTGDTLRIRKEPDPDAGVYALAARGESFEVVGESELEFSDGIHLSEDWAAIDYEGCTGYISSDFISVDFEVDSGETLQEIAAREAAQTKAITASAETAKGGRTKADTPAGETKKENAGVVPAGVSDAQLLAALIQCEAGGESYEGQLAVGAVVINRVRSGSYPSTIFRRHLRLRPIRPRRNRQSSLPAVQRNHQKQLPPGRQRSHKRHNQRRKRHPLPPRRQPRRNRYRQPRILVNILNFLFLPNPRSRASGSFLYFL